MAQRKRYPAILLLVGLVTVPFLVVAVLLLQYRVDIHEGDDSYRICVELPGFGEENIQVEVEDNLLRISGERKQDSGDEDGTRHRESLRGSFRRTFMLPEGVDSEAVKAGYANGVLEVTVPASKREGVAVFDR